MGREVSQGVRYSTQVKNSGGFLIVESEWWGRFETGKGVVRISDENYGEELDSLDGIWNRRLCLKGYYKQSLEAI